MRNNIEAQFKMTDLVDDFDLRAIFLYLKEKIKFVAIVTFAVFAIVTLVALTMLPKYSSTALIQVDNTPTASSGLSQALGDFSSMLMQTNAGVATPAEIQEALISSRFILEPTIEKLGLNISVSPHHFLSLGSSAFNPKVNDIVDANKVLMQYSSGDQSVAMTKFKTSPEFEGQRFRLEANGKNAYSLYGPDGSLLLHGQVGQTITTGAPYAITVSIEKLTARQGDSFNVIRMPTDIVMKRLSDNLNITELGKSTGVLQLTLKGYNPRLLPIILNTIVNYTLEKNIEKKSAEATQTLNFINDQIPGVKVSLNQAETALNKYRSKSGVIDMSLQAQVLLNQLTSIEQPLEALKLEKLQLLQQFTANHPFVIAITDKQKNLEKTAMQIQNQIKQLPLADQEAIGLERDVKVKNQLYLLLLNKIQELQVIKAGTISDIQILDVATYPIKPLPSYKAFMILGGLIIGFLLSAIILYVQRAMVRGVIDPDLVEQRLGINTYAIIPHSRKQGKLFDKVNQFLPATYQEKYILAQANPKDLAIEGIRSLRTSLELDFLGSKNKIISILGARPSIGKSFVSVNLSQVLVDSNKRVLLIDADLRKGKINRYLGQKQTPGLAELLSNKNTIAEVKKSISTRFDFISAGEFPRNPAELLMGGKLEEILTTLAADYDAIIIDTPPVLAVTDAILVAKYSAINLFLVGFGQDPLKELEFAAKHVQKNNIKINGLVFNNCIATPKAYTPYNYYYSYT